MPEPAFSWNLLVDAHELLRFHFMQNALFAGTIVALVAGLVGYFMVLRHESFAGHTLANVGFAGAAGAVLIGVSPVVGLLASGLLAALGIGALGGRPMGRTQPGGRTDIAVGTILALALGLGLLFDRLASVSANGVYAVLFGVVLGVSDQDIAVIAVTASLSLAVLACIGRPLLFASVDPEVAAVRGVPVRGLTYLFLAVLACAVAEAVQVVGVLLIFALLVTPAATALQFTARPVRALTISAVLAVAITWLGLAVAYYTPYPAGFFITTFAFAAYLLARGWRLVMRTRATAWRGRPSGRGTRATDEPGAASS